MMNLFSALQLGKNSLLAQQGIFQMIGHNIANVNTPGYSRQIAQLTDIAPPQLSDLSSGMGVDLESIKAVRSDFVDRQIVAKKQSVGLEDTMASFLSETESLFDETNGNGLSDYMTTFFNNWANVANNATSIPTRSDLTNQASSMASTFSNLYLKLSDQQKGLNDQMAIDVKDINTLANEIAKLNEQIFTSQNLKNDANDLIDQRMQKIKDLSEKIGVNVYYDTSRNSATVEVAGRPLVTYNQANQLSVIQNAANSNYYDLFMSQYNSPAINITQDVDSGKMAGLIAGRDINIAGYKKQLDDLAYSLVNQVNNLHQQGYSLPQNGSGQVTAIDLGGDPTGRTLLFTAIPATLRIGDAVSINGERHVVTAFAGANGLVFDQAFNANNLVGSAWTFSRTGLNFFQEVDNPNTIQVGNINNLTNTVTFTAPLVPGMLNVGDMITINGESRSILTVGANTVIVDQPFTFATAVPLNWQYVNHNRAAANIAVDDNILANPSLVAAADRASLGAVGNNGNASQLANMMNQMNTVDMDNNGIFDNSGTFHDYLHSSLATIGNDSSQAQFELEANTNAMTYLENERDRISGVSLDEEASLLMAFEKSYQAIAQFVGTVNKLTDVLISIGR